MFQEDNCFTLDWSACIKALWRSCFTRIFSYDSLWFWDL